MNAPSDIHVLPIRDLMEHLEHRECWCHPRIERVQMKVRRGFRADSAAVVVHNSMDGRELIEEHGVN